MNYVTTNARTFKLQKLPRLPASGSNLRLGRFGNLYIILAMGAIVQRPIANGTSAEHALLQVLAVKKPVFLRS
jgi:hypothetical protein